MSTSKGNSTMREKALKAETSERPIVRLWRGIVFITLALILMGVGAALVFPRHTVTLAAPAAPAVHKLAQGDWPTYMYNNKRSGYNSNETLLTRTSASRLKIHWNVKAGGSIFSQPVVSGGVIYWGSFDGYEHATDVNGNQLWQTNLGTISQCSPTNPLGIVSTATITTVSLNSVPTTVVFVAGGDDHMYALNAATGAIIWGTLLGAAGSNTFIWDSPLVYNGSVYIGTATTGEATNCSLVPGRFFQLDAATGTIQHAFDNVPAGCTGGGVWGSPTLDISDNSIYYTTGTQGKCKEKNAIGIVKLSLTDLSFIDSWSVPVADRVHDSDFGVTPTLFTATIGGTVHKLVGAANKNGYYYALDRSALSKGPVWQLQIAQGGACPQCGQGSISSSAWNDKYLYVAGGKTTINGIACNGALRALNPADGSIAWEACLSGTVMGAVTAVPGVVAVVAPKHLTLFDTGTGARLFDYSTANGTFYGAATISNGMLYVGNLGGKLYAFGL